MKHTYILVFLIFAMIFLSGCLYPDNELSKNQISNETQLELVQSAIENYQDKTNGLLPIRTKPSDTPIFEKYLIDFTLLKEQGSIAEIPGNAYENGGIYQYAILNPETDPKVKLIDLRITEALRSVNVRIDSFRNKHIYPPFGERIEGDIFAIDYKKIGLESPPVIESPYSDALLPIVLDATGKTYIDYRIDLNNALKEYKNSYQDGDDIRYLLAENTPFLPVYSLPYTIKDNEPVFMVE
ncbi:hypothetical protein [Ornithinibacillus bavariensis]|uniref:ABC transporter periplasmic binding protein yphF n=1 Tax=Ornithinibacillus bavariensis TaxID=545502 RepID=A0A919X9E9_9BACI|nr:hypothetical protein [Ornithinibacillus bavariensis]GIO28461.1 hypothetical protein J43TS3_30720 [Ornithinibacillus bavariensis]HAM81188.1 hypothetical protein [Ornithinibacillus sp.]